MGDEAPWVAELGRGVLPAGAGAGGLGTRPPGPPASSFSSETRAVSTIATPSHLISEMQFIHVATSCDGAVRGTDTFPVVFQPLRKWEGTRGYCRSTPTRSQASSRTETGPPCPNATSPARIPSTSSETPSRATCPGLASSLASPSSPCTTGAATR